MGQQLRQFAWFFGIWVMSVVALGVVSLAIRAVLKS